jgi:hypothetical protein
MKAAARQARSKPGHAWDAYSEMAKDLGRSARHFLPPFWEEVGRAFKDLGNQTYAGRALTKSLEAERVHALKSDQARRRDVVLEFVLSGCLAGSALSDYGNDLQSQYAPAEAFAIFRDLCMRRTRGGMSPWATMPKDFIKLARAAGLDGDIELERWLEEVIEAPAMARPPHQFWKTCSGHCQRIVARNPAFAIALLRHTRPEPRYYGESKLGPWFELLEEWDVIDFLWDDGHRGAPPLGEPIAVWFGRIVRDEIPAPQRTLEMLEKLAQRLKSENVPLPLSLRGRHHRSDDIDIDVLEACLTLGIKVEDPPQGVSVTFSGWLSANVDHRLRNQDLVASVRDDRFTAAIYQGLSEALACRGGMMQRGYRQTKLEQRAFPLAVGNRPGILELWRRHTENLLSVLEQSGLASFQMAQEKLAVTLWPDTLRLFPDLAERLQRIDPIAVLHQTLQAGIFDEFGWPAFEQVVDENKLSVHHAYHDTNIYLTFPSSVVSDKVHAYVIDGNGNVRKHEMRLPKKGEVTTLVVVGDDLAVSYRDDKYQGRFHWASNPSQHYEASAYFWGGTAQQFAAMLDDGSVFLGQQAVRPGDKQMPQSQPFVHDGSRFWRVSNEYDPALGENRSKMSEVDPSTGKALRESVPAWFEEAEGGTVMVGESDLRRAPAGAENSPLGTKDGMIGWKTVKRRDGGFFGVGIDGRRWDRPLLALDGSAGMPVALLRQPGTQEYLPVTTTGGRVGNYWLWDPSGSTVVAKLQDFTCEYAAGQVLVLPLHFWHLLHVRDEASSRNLRAISHAECSALFQASASDRALEQGTPRGIKETKPNPLVNLLPAVKKLLPSAPERMAVGVARVIEQAEREGAAFSALRDKIRAESTKESHSATLVVHHQSDLAAAYWGMPAFHIYGHEGHVSVIEHLVAVAEFLKGNSSGGDLPRTNYLWFSILDDLPLRCWQTYWRALAAKMEQKDNNDVPWLDFLKLWHELGIADLPGQFDVMEGHPEGVKKNQWGGFDVATSGGTAFTLQNDEDRFIVIENDAYHHNQLPYHFLRYSTAAKPGPPPGYQVKNTRSIKKKHAAAQIAAFIAAAESCTQPPLPSKEELAELAEKLSTSPAEIGLIWMGGLNLDSYQSNFLPAELRAAWGWKTTEAGAGRQALRNLNSSVLAHLYEVVVARGCAAPFAVDRTPVLRALENAWQAKMPKRLQLEAALQKRLSALGRSSRWIHMSNESILDIAANPTGHPHLQPREIEIKVDKNQTYSSLGLSAANKGEPAIHGDSLRVILQLVGLVHAETASGHPVRGDMPALIKQTTKLLGHAGTLLDLRTVHLYELGRKKPQKPSEWLNQHVGKTEVNTSDGTTRCEDGLIAAAALDNQHQVSVAFRPAKFKDKTDLARLLGILAIDVGPEYSVNNRFVPIVAAIKGPGFQKLAKAILAKDVPDGQWPQNPKHTAPEVVKAIGKKNKLSGDAAVLYAQLLALPDPTTANVCVWNGWTAAHTKKTAAELVGRKLVLQAVRARAGRSTFLPGEWMELKAPWLPIEGWKLAHLVEYDLDPGERCPAGGPMVLRPFADLFAAAWQRVVDGDAPRYDEVKRKKKTK